MSIFKKIVTYRPSFTVRILTGLISMLILLSVCTFIGLADRTRLNVRATEFDARSIEAGAKVYFDQCARCHGPNGEGVEGLGPALASEQFVGRIELVRDDMQMQSIKVVQPSERIKQIGWSGTLEDYIIAVTEAGIPIKTSNVWDVTHPTFSERLGGPLRGDQIRNVASFIVNYGLNPLPNDQALLPPAPGEGMAPRPTPVPLTAEQEAGKQVYLAKGCAACHAIRGVGAQGALGPNLTRIGSVAEERIASESYKTNLKDQPPATTAAEYIRQSILHPNAYIVAQCPQGPCQAGLMPQNYEQQLTPEELNNLVDYLSSLK
ncbi:MAG: c-type cytochrome [Anaerolineae bacterium]|nr:cytochrome c [Candidatus Roseilinea sp.]MDW8449549.1 c-type cytochrome [Anaerolineae bacterium]